MTPYPKLRQFLVGFFRFLALTSRRKIMSPGVRTGADREAEASTEESTEENKEETTEENKEEETDSPPEGDSAA